MKTNTMHSPGPWTADTCGYPIIINGAEGDNQRAFIAIIESPEVEPLYPKDDDENAANARLIAAAPDLLAAAKAVADDWTRGNVGTVKQAHGFALRAAIAKAEGREG